NMPSVFDFGFQTSHYSIPNDTLHGFVNGLQPNMGQNVASTNRNVFSNRSFDEKEMHFTVNMTNVIDGRELAGATYTYTTELQERDRKRKEPFQGR
ncbi:phage tail tape measure protein, partial [Bacillus cereus]|nr:phage tail tape measure protein [Bacillus cereus]MBJ8038369.1 phage tail tape measure protein [Bacillus cereus]